MTERVDIISKIANLRALADSSTSENESLNAVKTADKLMQAYRVTEAELAMAEADGSIKVEVVSEYQGGIMRGSNRHKVQMCIWNIASFCEVKAVLKWRRDYSTGYQKERFVHWIGDKPDVEMARWMLDMLRDALDREYESWKKDQQAVGRGAKGSFQTAMASRICDRLSRMTSERRSERERLLLEAQAALSKDDAEALGIAVSNGRIAEITDTALVVVSAAEVKEKEVAAAYDRAYGKVKLGTASGFRYRGGSTAAAAGRSAGARVNLGRPVGQSRARAIA